MNNSSYWYVYYAISKTDIFHFVVIPADKFNGANGATKEAKRLLIEKGHKKSEIIIMDVTR